MNIFALRSGGVIGSPIMRRRNWAMLFVELPAPGKQLAQGAEAAVVESVKAAA